MLSTSPSSDTGGVAPTTRRASIGATLSALLIDERDHDAPGVALPRPEVHLAVRFGPSVPHGLDIHALGVREHVHRKTLLRGHRAVVARLRLGVAPRVLGVSASALAGRIVALGELWGDAPTRRLLDRLSGTQSSAEAADIFERAIAEHLTTTSARSPSTRLALVAAEKLAVAPVNAVALELGVSERHLRRTFHDAVGLSPKAFARLARFHRALGESRSSERATWASIAAAAGYYDQAHLIAEFRAISGRTPRGLVAELRACPPFG